MANLARLLERYDQQIAGLEKQAIALLNQALADSFLQLQQELKQIYPQLQEEGSTVTTQRSLLLLNQLKSLMQLIDPSAVDALTQEMTSLIQDSQDQGQQMASDLIQAIAPHDFLESTARIPIEAAANAASESVKRLSRHSEEFRTRAAAIVTQGLIQGWGTAKVSQLLQQQLGTTKAKAETIARTEILAANNAAAVQTYQANGVSFVQVQATKDDRACPLCAARNMSVYEIGKVSVPFHPRCRCFLMPWNPRRQQLGLTNDKFAQDFYEETKKLVGGPLDNGPSAFEKYTGATSAPEPVWTPTNGYTDPALKPAPPSPPPAAAPAPPPAAKKSRSRKAPKPAPPTTIFGQPRQTTRLGQKWAPAWASAPPGLQAIVNALDDPQRVKSGSQTSFYQKGQNSGIHIAANYQPGSSDRADLTWRHEYGHYLDHQLSLLALQRYKQANPSISQQQAADVAGGNGDAGLRGLGYISSSRAGMAAFDKDTALTLDRQKQADAYYARITSQIPGPGNNRLKTMVQVAIDIQDSGLSPQDFAQQFFGNRQDIFAATFQQAIAQQRKTGSQVIDERSMAELISQAQAQDLEGLVNWVDTRLGTDGIANDIPGSLTQNRVGYGHTTQYYLARPSRVQAEAFANLVALHGAGEGSYYDQLAQYLAPNGYQFMRGAIQDATSGPGN